MSDFSDLQLPVPSLRRAANILNSNGYPVLVELVSPNDTNLTSPTHKREEKNSNLGASIKQKLKTVARSRSLSSTYPKERKGHTRSHSDAAETRPTLARKSLDLGTMLESPRCSDSIADVTIPLSLHQGTRMTKVSAKKRKNFVFRLDPDQGQIVWESKQHRISAFPFITMPLKASVCHCFLQPYQVRSLSQDFAIITVAE